MVRTLSIIAFSLALFVITLGALTRLMDAGLGCPDWPGCYGQLIPLQQSVGEQVVVIDRQKAWMEMLHRYAAGSLGLVIIGLTVASEKDKRLSSKDRWLSRLILLLVLLQALFGMWTVTLQLLPQIVTIHLLGGMLLLALLWLFVLRTRVVQQVAGQDLKPLAIVVLLLLSCQIALGGWTSSQYAGLSCPDFPTCQGKWLPELDLKQAFNLSHMPAANHEGGLLSPQARLTIQFVHRLLALLLSASILLLSLRMMAVAGLRIAALVLLGLTSLQVCLGIANAVLLLPLPLALAHNTGAALLLLAVIYINYRLSPGAGAANQMSRFSSLSVDEVH